MLRSPNLQSAHHSTLMCGAIVKAVNRVRPSAKRQQRLSDMISRAPCSMNGSHGRDKSIAYSMPLCYSVAACCKSTMEMRRNPLAGSLDPSEGPCSTAWMCSFGPETMTCWLPDGNSSCSCCVHACMRACMLERLAGCVGVVGGGGGGGDET